MSGSDRYFTNDHLGNTAHDVHLNLIASLTRIVTEVPPGESGIKWQFVGIYEGPTSLAFLFLNLSYIYPNLLIKEARLKDWAHKYLNIPRIREADPDGSNCGILNEKLSHLAVSAVVNEDNDAVKELCGWKDEIVKEGGYDEWAYGRAGYLYLLRFVKSKIPLDSVISLIDKTSSEIIERIFKSPQPWAIRDVVYLGAGHGILCIITQIVLSSPSSAPQLEQALIGLLKLQFESGNWPARLDAADRDELVQFCHGAPGFVLSLRSIRQHFPNLQDQIDTALEKAMDCTWTRGLLRKDPNLCHGIAGNSVAFDDKERIEHFMSFATPEKIKDGFASGLFKESDIPYGLWGGEGGRAWIWAVLDKDLGKNLIGYNDV